MNKLQLAVIGASILLFFGLFFGASTKASDFGEIQKKRSIAAASTDISSLLIDAKPSLSKQDAAFIISLERQIDDATEDFVRIDAYKKLASKWYEFRRADISGHYALKVAELEQTEDAWSIAGTTYMIGARQAQEEKIKKYCTSGAVSAFESAISLNPDNINHKVNLASCYAENPPQENPMKGVLMLLDLNKANPESVPVLLSLGRFGIETGQFDKAAERLTKAISIEPDNRRAFCLLADAYKGLGEMQKATEAQEKCALQ